MKTLTTLLFALLISLSAYPKDVINIAGIHMRVSHTRSEDKRQQTGLSNQTQNTAVEEVNKSQTKKYKEKAKEVQQRLEKLSIVLDVANITQEGIKITKNIKEQQSYVVGEIIKSPHLIFLQVNQIKEMATQVELLGRYLAGAVLTGADIYAMENADRKVIVNFIIAELRALKYTSWQMYMTIRSIRISQQLKAGAFKNWLNKDKEIVKEIIENAKKL